MFEYFAHILERTKFSTETCRVNFFVYISHYFIYYSKLSYY